VLAPNTNWTVNYFSTSSADFGVLHAYASLFLTGDASLGPLNGGSVPWPSLASVGGRAGFRDGYTITGGSGQGTLYLTFTVTGSATSTNGAAGRTVVQRVPIVNGVEDWNNLSSYGVSSAGTAIIPIAFTFGQRIDIEILFYALAQIFFANGWTTGASATADYSHTATLTQIMVRDATGNVVRPFQLFADSATEYDSDGVFSRVPIMVKPGESTPAINTASRGRTSVAILSTPSFDAARAVDRSSLSFGKTGLEQTLVSCDDVVRDVNSDGLPDLICGFVTEATALGPTDTSAVLRGRTLAGMPVRGTDDVRVVR